MAGFGYGVVTRVAKHAKAPPEAVSAGLTANIWSSEAGSAAAESWWRESEREWAVPAENGSEVVGVESGIVGVSRVGNKVVDCVEWRVESSD